MSIRTWLGVFALATLSACTTTSATGGGAAATVQSATQAVSTDSSVTFHNSSNWAIMRIHLSPVSQATWGPDQLGSSVLSTGGSFTLHGVPCDSYDLKLVDQDGDECILNAVNICAENSGWDIDNNDLLSCQAFTRNQH